MAAAAYDMPKYRTFPAWMRSSTARVAKLHVGGDHGPPAGGHNVRQGQQAGELGIVRDVRGGDQGAVGQWDAEQFGLGAADELAVLARAGISGLAVGAGAIGDEERADDELAGLIVVTSPATSTRSKFPPTPA